LQEKSSPFAIFTFASRHPCKWVLSVVRIRWAVRTDIEHWFSETGVWTLFLAVQAVCWGTDFTDLQRFFFQQAFAFLDKYFKFFLIQLFPFLINNLAIIFWKSSSITESLIRQCFCRNNVANKNKSTFYISIFFKKKNLSLCISLINNDKINLINPHASIWSIELDTIEGSIEHPTYHSALVWLIELYGFCIIYACVLAQLIIIRSIRLIVIQSNDQSNLTRLKVWSNIQLILMH
jgi:hypothetical protein